MIVIHDKTFVCPPPWRAWDTLAERIQPAFLWRGREDEDLYLALGARRSFSSIEECRAELRKTHAERAFCATAFDPAGGMKAPWDGFARKLLVVPEVVVRWRDGRATILECTRSDGREIAEVLRNPPAPVKPLAVDGGRTFSWRRWAIAVHAIRAAIRGGAVDKVVLARDSIREMSSPIHAGVVLDQLAQAAADCYLFAYGIGGAAFLSATPERLFRLEGNRIETESLAGTRPRGAGAEEDERLARELLDSDKDKAEQKIVTRFIVEKLTSLCTSLKEDSEPRVRRLAHVQHLCTRVEGRLKADTSLDDVVDALHPTPAVCGMPREAARKMIAELEPMSRGLYAGAVGWLEAERAEFAVAIRSALIRERFIHIFAGAGIMQQSDPRAEWMETALKMKGMLTASGCKIR